MEVNIVNEIGVCEEFIEEGTKKKIASTIIISPLKIVGGEGENDLRIISGCNMWQACHNPKCHFSRAGREKPKVVPRVQSG